MIINIINVTKLNLSPTKKENFKEFLHANYTVTIGKSNQVMPLL